MNKSQAVSSIFRLNHPHQSDGFQLVVELVIPPGPDDAPELQHEPVVEGEVDPVVPADEGDVVGAQTDPDREGGRVVGRLGAHRDEGCLHASGRHVPVGIGEACID